MSNPREIVEKIRKIMFGIGLDTTQLDPDLKEAFQDKAEVLKNASELVSEINSRKPRFIFELIQNAEDNDYAEGVNPRIRFIVNKEQITVQNNETGFQEENVRALCRIGGSTKKREKARGYIGEKGIGFKSVFMVTNSPKVFSNGFHFGFNFTPEDYTSLIIPSWLENKPDYFSKKETNLVIPLKDEVKHLISDFISEITPSLLLFLKKLRIIEVQNEITKKCQTFKRLDHNGLIEIRHSSERNYWKTTIKSVETDPNVQEERRKDISKTEIMLAFPSRTNGKALVLEEQNVFAFLPIRKFGFNFIIHCDFIVNAGRDDIIDNSWNQFLRNKLPSVILQAINSFKNDENLRYNFYGYIPSETKITDSFFSPVVQILYKNLQDTDFLLSENENWKKPSEIIIADKKIRKLITNETIKSAIGKEYLSLKAKVPQEILTNLKVENFGFNILVKLLSDIQWLTRQDDNWFALLYEYLSFANLNKEQMETLKALSIFRLENQIVESITKGPIFFPFSLEDKYGFEDELRVIKKNIIEIIRKKSAKKSAHIKSFLKRLGVQEHQPYEMIENIILPLYESETDEWGKKTYDVLLGHVRYIKDNIEKYERISSKHLAELHPYGQKLDPLNRLKSNLLLRIVNSKWEYAHPDEVYLPSVYGKNISEELFSKLDSACFLHPSYFDFEKNRLAKIPVATAEDKAKLKRKELNALRNWKDFLLKIGVSTGLVVLKDPDTEVYQGSSYARSEVTRKHLYNYQKKESIWKNFEWRDSDSGYYIQDDWFSEHFVEFSNNLNLLTEKQRLEKAKKLMMKLADLWNIYTRYTSCKYYYRRLGWSGWSSDTTRSTFILTLQNSEWCPTSNGVLTKPENVFVDKTEIKELLNDSVHYLGIKITNPQFLEDLSFHTEVNVSDVLNYLSLISKQPAVSNAQLERLYRFLDRHFQGNEEEIQKFFSKKPSIVLGNQVFGIEEVFWDDVSEIFGQKWGYLKNHYPLLKSFFVDKLHVSEKPSYKNYADLVVQISNENSQKVANPDLILRIYEELNHGVSQRLTQSPICNEDWWKVFSQSKVFLTSTCEFKSNENEQVLVSDSPKLCNLFVNSSNISFLWLPNDYNPEKISDFIDLVGLRYLTEAVEKTPNLDMAKIQKSDSLTAQFRGLIDYYLRYLYWESFSKYETIKHNYKKLLALEIYVVDLVNVNLSIRLKDKSTIAVSSEDTSVLWDNNLIISNETATHIDRFAVEISKVFSTSMEIASFSISLLNKKSDIDRRDMMKLIEINDLPIKERQFLESSRSEPIIPQQIIIEQPVIQPEMGNNEPILQEQAVQAELIEKELEVMVSAETTDSKAKPIEDNIIVQTISTQELTNTAVENQESEQPQLSVAETSVENLIENAAQVAEKTTEKNVTGVETKAEVESKPPEQLTSCEAKPAEEMAEAIDNQPLSEQSNEQPSVNREPIIIEQEAANESEANKKAEENDKELPIQETRQEESTVLAETIVPKEQTVDESLTEVFIDEEPIMFPEDPTDEPLVEEPPSEQPEETPLEPDEVPQKQTTYPIVREQRDTKRTKQVKQKYVYNCQICLSKEIPGILSYPNSYAEPQANRQGMIQGHHIKEIRDEGHDHLGNILSLCVYHHISCLHKHPFKEELIDIIDKSLENVTEKDIIWSTKVTKWRIMKTEKTLMDGTPLQFVFDPQHLEIVKKYIEFLKQQASAKKS
jgi:predicted restriction endonuclease